MKIQRLTTLALSLSALFGAAAVAQARPDVVNIAAPNGANISHNYYNRLNINQNGLVLNNSTTAGVSELAGALGANPKFRGRAADTILMEVRVPGQASHLGGALESFGKRADVIIANPNGIVVDGVRTINLRSLTLMDAGTRRRHSLDFHFDNDAINSKGVTIEGHGIYTMGLNFFDILSNRIQINGSVVADNNELAVNLRSGVSRYSYDARSEKGLKEANVTKAAPSDAVHISASEAGSMYGGYITIKTSSGGIDLQNQIRSAESLAISADGNVSVNEFGTGRAHVRGSNVTLTGQGTASEDITTSASYANGNITLERNASLTSVGGNIRLKASSVDLNGSLRADLAAIDIQARSLTTRSGRYIARQFHAAAEQAKLMGGDIGADTVYLVADGPLTLGSGFGVRASDNLFIQSGTTLENKSRGIRGGSIYADAKHIRNEGRLQSRQGKVNVITYSLENLRWAEINGAAGVAIDFRQSDENATLVNMGEILSDTKAKYGEDAIFIRTKGSFINAPRAAVKTKIRHGNINIQAAEGVDLERGSRIFGDHITFTAAKLRTEDGEAKAAEITYDAKSDSYIVDGRVYTKTRSRFDNEERYMDYSGRLYTERELMDQVAKDNLDLRDYLGTGYGGGYHGGSNVDINTDAKSLKTAFGK